MHVQTKKKKKIRALGTEGVIHMNYVRGQDDSAAQIEKCSPQICRYIWLLPDDLAFIGLFKSVQKIY
jgi:hypothetical protein